MTTHRIATVLAACALALFAWTFAPPSAAAQSKRDVAKAKRLFKVGNKAFDAGRYSDALASYRASYKHYPRPSTLFNIAVCRDRLGDLEGAYVDYAAFVEAAEADDAALVTRAKARLTELNASLTLAVQVTSAPAGAAVFVDGGDAVAGRTPITLQLSPGAHTLRFEARKHVTASQDVTVVPGTPTRVDATLEALATISVTATPADATIRLDGADASGSGALTVTVPAGAHAFSVEREGHAPRRLEVSVTAGETVARAVALERTEPAAEASPPPSAPDPGTPRAGGGLRMAGVGIGVVGVVLTGVAVQQGLSARSSSDDAQTAAAAGAFDAGAFGDAETAEKRMFLLYGVGGAAIVTGAAVYYLGHRKGARAERQRVSVQPSPAGTGALVTVGGAF